MKKLLILALILVFSLSMAARAEEGVRVEFGNTFSLTCPADLDVIELTAEDTAEGTVYAAISDELEIYVYSYPMDGMSAEELYDMYREDEFNEDVTIARAGEIEYLTYPLDDECLSAIFVCEDGNYYEILFCGVTEAAMAEARQILEGILPV